MQPCGQTGRTCFNEQELTAAIRSAGRDRYAVSGTFLRGALGKLAGARALGKFTPAFEDGRRVGLRIRGVRKGSALAQLGIRSGDILRTLNGVSLATVDGALQTYALLPRRGMFSLALLRSGEPRTLEYVVE